MESMKLNETVKACFSRSCTVCKCFKADNQWSTACPFVSSMSFANHNSLSEQEAIHFFPPYKIKMLPKEADTDAAQAL